MFNSQSFNSIPFNAEQPSSGVSTPSNIFNGAGFNSVPFNANGSSGTSQVTGATVAALAEDVLTVTSNSTSLKNFGLSAVDSINIYGSITPVLQDLLLENINVLETVIELHGFGRSCTEAIQVSENITNLMNLLALELVKVSSPMVGEQTLYPSLSDILKFTDKVLLARSGLLIDSLTSSDTSLGAKYFIASVAESLIVSNTVSGYAEAASVLAEAILTSDSLADHFLGELLDNLNISNIIDITKKSLTEVIEGILIQDSVVSSALIAMIFDESIELNSNLTFNQVIITSLADQADFFISLPLDNNIYSGWVMNAKTHDVSEYSNFPFNSYCEFNNEFYAASSSGLFKLGGDLDGTETISASFSSGSSDFGTSQLKRAERIFIGYRADGQLALKVTTGEDIERWYELSESKTENGLHEARIKLGKGVKSRYWQFALTNKNGADFNIDSFEFVEINLTRKVRR